MLNECISKCEAERNGKRDVIIITKGTTETTDDLVYRALFVGIYVLFFGVRGYYRFVKPRKDQTDQEESEAERKSSGRVESAIAIIVLGFFLSIILYLIGIPWMDWSQIPTYPIWLRLLGILKFLQSSSML